MSELKSVEGALELSDSIVELERDELEVEEDSSSTSGVSELTKEGLDWEGGSSESEEIVFTTSSSENELLLLPPESPVNEGCPSVAPPMSLSERDNGLSEGTADDSSALVDSSLLSYERGNMKW